MLAFWCCKVGKREGVQVCAACAAFCRASQADMMPRRAEWIIVETDDQGHARTQEAVLPVPPMWREHAQEIVDLINASVPVGVRTWKVERVGYVPKGS